MEFPDQDDLLNFKLIISPDEVGKITIMQSVSTTFIFLSVYYRDFIEGENLLLASKLVLGIPMNHPKLNVKHRCITQTLTLRAMFVSTF